MPKKNRTTLRNYFLSGNMPREDHFQDLIDSSLNLIEEGFDRSPDTGMKVTTMGMRDELTSYFRYDDVQNPVWTIKFGDADNSLQWTHRTPASYASKSDSQSTPVLVLTEQGAVGVGKAQPRPGLDVAGFVRSEGRSGGITKHVPADGKWTPITEPLQGCHGFEVIAGAGGKPRDGQYTLLHAIALKSYQRKGSLARWRDKYRGITTTAGGYRNRHNDIKLKWYPCAEDDTKYQLWIRSKCPYGADAMIQVHLTRLWEDHDMSQSRAQRG